MNILVTGATGFIGHHLCERLKAEGHTVTALGRKPAIGPWDDFISCDLETASPEIHQLSTIEAIFHFAGKAHALSESPAESESYFRIIRDGTKRLLATADTAGVQQFIYASTVKAAANADREREYYASGPTQPLSENDAFEPDTPYGQAKRESEALVIASKISHVAIIRPTLVYGPGNKGNLHAMIEAVRKNRFPPLPDTGNKRSLVHVDDLVQATCLCLSNPKADRQVFTISDGQAYSTRDIYNAIRTALDLKPTSTEVPLSMLKAAAKAGDFLEFFLRRRLPLDSDKLAKLTDSAWYSSAKAQKVLDYQPKISLPEGLKTML